MKCLRPVFIVELCHVVDDVLQAGNNNFVVLATGFLLKMRDRIECGKNILEKEELSILIDRWLRALV